MNKKWILAIGLFLMIGLFGNISSTRAGGWATLTLSKLPEEVVAEQPFTIEFLLLQHGQTPLSGSDILTEVKATHPESGAQLSFSVEPGKEPGYYEVTITLPQSGKWQWEIEAFTAVYPMPPLTVNEAAVVVSDGSGETAVAWQLILGWVAALGTVLVFFFWTQQKSRPRLAGAVLLGVISLAGFGLYWQMPMAVQAENEVATVPAIAPEAIGEALFVAKGCIQCHTNDNVTMAENMFSIGPDITFVKRPSEYVQSWLADPSALKADTQMPNLDLSQAEINTFAAFLQQD